MVFFFLIGAGCPIFNGKPPGRSKSSMSFPFFEGGHEPPVYTARKSFPFKRKQTLFDHRLATRADAKNASDAARRKGEGELGRDATTSTRSSNGGGALSPSIQRVVSMASTQG